MTKKPVILVSFLYLFIFIYMPYINNLVHNVVLYDAVYLTGVSISTATNFDDSNSTIFSFVVEDNCDIAK